MPLTAGSTVSNDHVSGAIVKGFLAIAAIMCSAKKQAKRS
jgi:hypothetical protein